MAGKKHEKHVILLGAHPTHMTFDHSHSVCVSAILMIFVMWNHLSKAVPTTKVGITRAALLVLGSKTLFLTPPPFAEVPTPEWLWGAKSQTDVFVKFWDLKALWVIFRIDFGKCIKIFERHHIGMC